MLQQRWYPEAPPRYRMASGAVVSLDAPGYDLTQPWFASFRLQIEPPYTAGTPVMRNRAFQIGPVGILATHTEYILKGRVTEQLSLGGGTLVIARSDVADRGLAGWRGRWHEMYAWLNTPGTTTRDVLAIFDRLTFEDTPTGLLVHTATVPRESIYAEEVKKHIPGAGRLVIRSGTASLELVPKWAGAKVRSGEVWQRAADDGARTFMHASRTAVTFVDPEDPTDGADSARLRFLEQLASISWTGDQRTR